MKDVSVIVATARKPESVARTLSSLASLDLRGVSVEIILAENGPNTGSVAAHPWANMALPFSVVRIKRSDANKSRALNQALEVARGQMLAFTDDDVVVDPGWICGLWHSFCKHPQTAVFCGPIVPVFAPGTPGWITSHVLCSMLYARYLLPCDGMYERPIPYGANCAVRADAIGGLRFREDLGPSLDHGPLFSDDTDFLSALISANEPVSGRQTFRYCSTAVVAHSVPQERTTLAYIRDRSFFEGVSCARAEHTTTNCRHLEMILYNSRSSQRELSLSRMIIANYLAGQWCEFERAGALGHRKYVEATLRDLNLGERSYLIGLAARESSVYRSLTSPLRNSRLIPIRNASNTGIV